jgi:multiple sugar transport system permease protein
MRSNTAQEAPVPPPLKAVPATPPHPPSVERRDERRLALWLVAPAVVLLGAVAVYPILAAIWLALHRAILLFHERSFIGLENFAFLVQDGRFWNALGNTMYFAAVAVSIELLLGLGFALLLHAPSKGKGLLRASVLVPWAIPTVVSAKMWAWMFNPDHGVLPALLAQGHTNWLGTPGAALHAAIAVDVWKTTPFMALLLLAGLQGISEDLYKAARVDGASRLRMFLRITLPLLKPAIALAVLFRALDAVRVFDAIYVLTEGGPANTTETLSIYAYKTLMRTGDFGYGSALAMATFLVVAILSVVYVAVFGKALQPEVRR